jgi:hypothetical protein
VTVSIAVVATAATEVTTRPLHLVLADLGQHHAGIVEVRLTYPTISAEAERPLDSR